MILILVAAMKRLKVCLPQASFGNVVQKYTFSQFQNIGVYSCHAPFHNSPLETK